MTALTISRKEFQKMRINTFKELISYKITDGKVTEMEFKDGRIVQIED